MALIGILEARRFFRCVMCSVRTAARFTERERVSMRIIHCPGMCGNLTAIVISNTQACESEHGHPKWLVFSPTLC